MRSTIVAILFLAALCLGLPVGCSDREPSSPAETDPDDRQETVPSGADAFVDPEAPDENFGDATSGKIRGDAHYLVYMSQATLHAFRRAPLHDAVLTIPLQAPVSSDLAGAVVELRPMLRPWAEKRVTWNCSGHYRLATGSRQCRDSWQGGQRAWGQPSATITLQGGETELTFPIAKDVDKFLYRGVRNNGWIVRLSGNHDEGLEIMAREGGNTANLNLRLGTVQAAQAVIPAAADTEVSLPHTNFGTKTSARVYGDRYRVALQFDMAAIEAEVGDDILTEAEVKVSYNDPVTSGNHGKVLELRRLLVPWEELNATGFCANDADPSANSWNDTDCAEEDRWNNGDAPWAPPSATMPLATGATAAVFNVTNDVNAWLRGDIENYGWIITSPEGDDSLARYVDIVTREGGAPVSALCRGAGCGGPTAPELMIETEPGPNPPDLPPDPETVAPPLDSTEEVTPAEQWEFLFAASDPVQTGVSAGAIEENRIALVRGLVRTRSGAPIKGATITVLDHSELGSTLSRTDGRFDLTINAGDRVVLSVVADGRAEVRRPVDLKWEGQIVLDDIVMIGDDAAVTTIIPNHSEMQIVEATPSIDEVGARQQILLFQPGTNATMEVTGTGDVQLTSPFNVRSSEYTVGEDGPDAMPAELPKNTGYTYAINLTVDEAQAAGATTVHFDTPVIGYNEDFMGFDVGGPAPAGYYDDEEATWEGYKSGIVVQVIDDGGSPALDVNGQGTPATQQELDELGITAEELALVLPRYEAGTKLWRVEIPHFSDWDINWGTAPPPDAGDPPGDPPGPPPPPCGCGACSSPSPPGPPPVPPGPLSPPEFSEGSIIQCASQVLQEQLPVIGTPLTLTYSSARVAGSPYYQFEIPISKDEIPGSPTRIIIELTIAGRKLEYNYEPEPNQVAKITWDGFDAYGRRTHGAQPARVCVGYDYPAQRVTGGLRETFEAVFGYSGLGENVSTPERGRGFTFWKCHEQTTAGGGISGTGNNDFQLGTFDAKDGAVGLGGWTLSVHHSLGAQGGVVYLGNGSQQSLQASPLLIHTFAGAGPAGAPAHGADRMDVRFVPRALASAPDGSLYVATEYKQVLRIRPDGFVEHIAGVGSSSAGFSGDGGPAVDAEFGTILGLGVGPDGAVYITDWDTGRVRRVKDGIVETVAGGGAVGGTPVPDGTLATDADLERTTDVDFLGSGEMVVIAHGRGAIYTIDKDDRLHRVTGSPIAGWLIPDRQAAYPSGLPDDRFAAQYSVMDDLYHLATVGDSIYVSSLGHTTGGPNNSSGIFRLDSVLDTIVGDVRSLSGVAANEAGTVIFHATGDAVGGSGGEQYDAPQYAIWATGGAVPLAGGGDDVTSEGIPARNARLRWIHDIELGADGSIYVAEYDSEVVPRIRKISPAIPSANPLGNTVSVPSTDRREVYVFSASGRHLETRSALTDALLWSFAYDANGKLSTITDRNQRDTTILRNGNTVTITSPDGLPTTLTLDANGYAESIANPASEANLFGYTADGLMTSMTTPRNHTSNFFYDADGRLERDENAAGGEQSLLRVATPNGVTVTREQLADAAAQSSYSYTYDIERTGHDPNNPTQSGAEIRTYTAPDGSEEQWSFLPNGDTKTTHEDGTKVVTQLSPDPQWLMLAPNVALREETLPSGLSRTVYSNRDLTGGNVVSEISINDPSFSAPLRDIYDPVGGIRTLTTPEGVTTTATMDSLGKLTSIQTGNLPPVALTYDQLGRLEYVTQSDGTETRIQQFAYDTHGFAQSVTDPLGRVISYENDLAGRPTTITLQDLQEIGLSFYEDGSLQTVAPPGRPSHGFDYDETGRVKFYDPPATPEVLAPRTTYNYNLAGQVESITRPDGILLDLVYDPATGRLDEIVVPDGSYIRTPDVHGRLETVADPYGSTLTYAYDGPLPLSESISGDVNSSLVRTYDTNFRLESETVNGVLLASYVYDDDDRVTVAGSATLDYDPNNGLLTDTAVGDVSGAILYDGFGHPRTFSYEFQGQTIAELTYTPDAAGRMGSRMESVGSVTYLRCYAYDDRDRLTQVTDAMDANGCTGALLEEYDYDANSNRIYALNSAGVADHVVTDDQDRLLEYEDFRFTYTDAGELETRLDVSSGSTWDYEFNALGHLTQVEQSDGVIVSYVVDPIGRRIGRKVDGSLVQGFVYRDPLSPVAELDGTGAIVSRFVYASRAHVPDYMIKAGTTYRIISDYLGTVVAVVDVSTGAPAQEITYDSWGRILTDTNPGFQPFAFAGGLYDQDTRLLHFGARDYDPGLGRWISKDPIGFASGDPNLYSYVEQNPASMFDPTGLDGWVCWRKLSEKPEEGLGVHKYACVTLPNGSVQCDSTNFNDENYSDWWLPFPTPGQPSDPGDDYFNEPNCAKLDDDKDDCFERCMLRHWRQDRPPYAIGWLGIDCIEYTDMTTWDCFTRCN